MHAMTSPQAWRDYGRACRINPNEEFNFLWANLIRHQGETGQDRVQCYAGFMEAHTADQASREVK